MVARDNLVRSRNPKAGVRLLLYAAAEEAAKAKARINFLMHDRPFLALYRSNDPNVRAAAMDKLNKAHHQAYGDTPTKDADAGTGWK